MPLRVLRHDVYAAFSTLPPPLLRHAYRCSMLLPPAMPPRADAMAAAVAADAAYGARKITRERVARHDMARDALLTR